MNRVLLKVRDVKKVYRQGHKDLTVLRDINLDVVEGEILTIVGPSGAGKSTLLHIMGGLDEATSGEVLVDDTLLSSLRESELSRMRNRQFGFVFQFYHLLREFNALENVMMPALVSRGISSGQIRQKARGLLEELGLGARIFHRPSELSGGEQQRVAIARSLINDPQILFCDEPTGNLDSVAGRQIQNLLWDLNRQRAMTVVIVTHSRELAESAHGVLSILDGKIVQPALKSGS